VLIIVSFQMVYVIECWKRRVPFICMAWVTWESPCERNIYVK